MQRLTLDLNRTIDEASFVVSQPSDWLVLTFDWEETMTWGELWLIDPAGRLRFTYMDVYRSRTVVIHREVNLNSYTAVPGMIEEGEWKIRLIRHIPQQFVLEWQYGLGELPDSSLVMETERDSWTTGVDGDTQTHMLNSYPWERCLEEGRRWYKGDCHAHTTLSDGKMTPELVMEQAEKRELDFFFITDHNTLPSSWPRGKVLVIPGMEFTSFGRGDWNALGMKEWMDCWDKVHGGLRTDEGQRLLLEEAAKQGAFRVINHPIAGRFSWRYLYTSIASIDGIEIWNSPYERKSIVSNERALLLWSALWNEGYRIVGLGGSDIHRLPEDVSEEHDMPPTIGDPATYVYAEQLSPTAILAAIRAGHTYVSRGPELTVSYTVEGSEQTFVFGDDLTDAMKQSPTGIVHCRLLIRSAEGAIVRCIVNGAEVEAKRITADEQLCEFRFDWKAAEYVWSRLEVRSENNQLLAVSNPIFYGSKKPTIQTWQELLQQVGFVLPD